MMNKKLAIVSVAVAMVGFAMTSGALAWPGCLNGGPGYGPGYGPGPMDPAAVTEHVQKQGEQLEKALGLKDNQKTAFEAYAKTRANAVNERIAWREKFDRPCKDMQQRADRRAERAQLEAKLTKELAESRAAFVKTLSPEQLEAFDAFEYRHDGRGFRHGPRHRGPYHDGYGPRGPHHDGYGPRGEGYGPGYGPANGAPCPAYDGYGPYHHRGHW